MTDQAPSVGRMVHYVSYGTPGGEYSSECRAAVVTEVHTADTIGLGVLNPTGMFFNRNVPYGPAIGSETNGFSSLCDGNEHEGGTWHWPARV